MSLSGLVFATKIDRMILNQNIYILYIGFDGLPWWLTWHLCLYICEKCEMSCLWHRNGRTVESSAVFSLSWIRNISSQRVVKSSRTSPWSYGWQPGGGWHVLRCDRLAQLIGTARNVPSQGFDLLPRWPMLWSSVYKNTPVLPSMSDLNIKDVFAGIRRGSV